MSKAELKCVIFVEGEDDVMSWEYNDIRKFFIQRLKSNDINHFHVSSRKEGSFKFAPFIEEILEDDDD
tara:strand:- start:76 stop:279 length:204 start_codon:yes stop_codon:yes gene_type:complete